MPVLAIVIAYPDDDVCARQRGAVVGVAEVDERLLGGLLDHQHRVGHQDQLPPTHSVGDGFDHVRANRELLIQRQRFGAGHVLAGIAGLVSPFSN